MQSSTYTRLLLAVTLALLGLPDGARGAGRTDADSTRRTDDTGPAALPAVWSTTARYTHSRFSSDRPSWHSESVLVRRSVPRRSTLDFQTGIVGRHGENDPFAAVDAYRTFGPRMYANLRLSAAPAATVLPRTDVYTEIFVLPGRGWEVSAGYRRADYREAGANTWLVGVARYQGNWYARVRSSGTQVVGSFGYAVMGTIRYYFGWPEQHVGFTVARGREVVAFPGATGIEARTPLSGSFVYQRDVTSNAGIQLGVEVVDDGDLSRWGFVTGVLWSW